MANWFNHLSSCLLQSRASARSTIIIPLLCVICNAAKASASRPERRWPPVSEFHHSPQSKLASPRQDGAPEPHCGSTICARLPSAPAGFLLAPPVAALLPRCWLVSSTRTRLHFARSTRNGGLAKPSPNYWFP